MKKQITCRSIAMNIFPGVGETELFAFSINLCSTLDSENHDSLSLSNVTQGQQN